MLSPLLHLSLAALAAAIISLSAGLPAAAETRSVATPRGASITVVSEVPEGPGPFPAVVLGPGTGSLRQKINDAVADALLQNGFAVYRFDWAYYVKDRAGLPSDANRAPEIEDFNTVIALVKADGRVDPSRIVIGGKSRGTIIGWRVFRADPTLRGILQLTPVCTKEGFAVSDLYPDASAESRPSLWVFGDVDPACRAQTLYAFIAGAGPTARAASLRGDHGLSSDPTLALAGALAVDFARGVTGPATPGK